MTEYWVSQGNKWCEFCKIYIANNVSSIRNHELGQRHKDNVARRLDAMRKENAAKEKEQEQIARAIIQIEAKAMRSSEKDAAALKESKPIHDECTPETSNEWNRDTKTGYYNNPSTGCYYDPKSHFYYTQSIGQWVTKEEIDSYLDSNPKVVPVSENGRASDSRNGLPPGRVMSGSLDPTRAVKGRPSSLNMGKRKRPNEKPKAVSAEEIAALKAREAARKRVEEREKNLLGLYKSR